MENTAEILALIKSRQVDQAEVYFQKSKSLKVSVINAKLENSEEIQDCGIGLRIIKNKKQGFSFTSDLEPEAIENTIEQALNNAAASNADEFHCLPSAQEYKKPKALFDENIAKTSIEEKIKLALKIEETAYKTDKRIRKTEKILYFDHEEEVAIVNSNGINASYRSNHCGAMAQVIAQHNGEMEYGAASDSVKKFDKLDPEKIAKEASHQAIELLGAKSISSQKLPIILSSEIGAELLEVLSGPLTAEAVQKGKSLFLNKLNAAVASKLVTLVDNGLLLDGIATAPFDAEGIPCQETMLISNGVLTNYLFNSYTGKKQGIKSTGNAARGSFMAPPSTGATNFYLKPGKTSEKELLKSTKKAIYITRVMGLHTANPISGDFSLGASGLMIENGETTHAVKGITIAGNLIEMLKQIEAVGSNLRFFGSVGSPSLLISSISISGN